MATISSLGVGSGVLTADLVDQLVAAERKPTELRLDNRQARTEALISAYGQIRSAVTELRLPMRQLSSPDSLRAFSATSTNSNISVAVDAGKASRGTYAMNVTQLAQAQALASGTFADRDATPVGTGSLTFTVGDKVTSITIDSSNNTLQGLANAINQAGVGASAGIIDTGNGYRLVLSADETGEANAVNIAVNTTDNPGEGLNRFAFDLSDPDGSGLTQTVAAQNAVLEINGIEISRATNTIENVIDGLTFTLTGEGASTVKVEQDTAAVAERVQEFVDKFNALQQIITELSKFDAETGQGSILTGDSTVRSIQNELRNVITSVVPGLENASVRSLADVGISTNFQTGELQFNSNVFQQKLRENPADVTALFAEQGRTTDAQVEFVRSSTATQAGSYDINVTQMATRGALDFDLSGTSEPIAIASDASMTFRVDGATNATITLAEGSYTRAKLAEEIQNQLNSNAALTAAGRTVQVGFDAGSGQLVFTSGKFGSESNVSLTAIDAGTSAALGISNKTGTAGVNVAGTINGVQAQGDGQVLFLGRDKGPASGLQVRITGGDVGARGQITFIEGVAERTVNLVTNILAQDGSLDSRTSSLNRTLEDIQEERVKLDIRLESLRERLVRQFTAADSLIARLSSTQDFVTQQLEALAPQNNRRK